jgi:hypothetical protein
MASANMGHALQQQLLFSNDIDPREMVFFKAVFNANVISDEILCQNLYFKPISKEFSKIPFKLAFQRGQKKLFCQGRTSSLNACKRKLHFQTHCMNNT